MQLHHWDGPAKGSPRARKSGPRCYTRKQVLAAVAQAIDELGPRLSSTEYERWRALRLHAARAAGRPRPPLPTLSTIWRRMGGWDTALLAAQPDRPDDEDTQPPDTDTQRPLFRLVDSDDPPAPNRQAPAKPREPFKPITFR